MRLLGLPTRRIACQKTETLTIKTRTTRCRVKAAEVRAADRVDPAAPADRQAPVPAIPERAAQDSVPAAAPVVEAQAAADPEAAGSVEAVTPDAVAEEWVAVRVAAVAPPGVDSEMSSAARAADLRAEAREAAAEVVAPAAEIANPLHLTNGAEAILASAPLAFLPARRPAVSFSSRSGLNFQRTRGSHCDTIPFQSTQTRARGGEETDLRERGSRDRARAHRRSLFDRQSHLESGEQLNVTIAHDDSEQSRRDVPRSLRAGQDQRRPVPDGDPRFRLSERTALLRDSPRRSRRA